MSNPVGRPRVWPPTIHHHSSGRDRIRILGRDVWLGATGLESTRQRYLEIVLHVEQHGCLPAAEPSAGSSIRVDELVARYQIDRNPVWQRSDGSKKQEAHSHGYAMRPLLHAIGTMEAASVLPRHLRAVRQLMIAGYQHPQFGKQKPQNVVTVSNNFNRIRRVFHWGAEELLIPTESYYRLWLIRRLRKGESGVADSPGVRPVPESDLASTLQELRPIHAAMVRLQLLCGCRAGEIVRLCPGDLDRSGSVWRWNLREHKNAWRGHERVIYLGPEAQRVLAPFLDRPDDRPCFSPQDMCAGMPPRHDGKVPGLWYNVTAYNHAIRRACRRANVPEWSPGQLRHNAGTRFVREFGWDVARQLLGHKHIQTTRIYADDSPEAVLDAMARAG